MSPSGLVLIADVVHSSTVREFATQRDRRLAAFSQRDLVRGWIGAPYAVTAWDEFQTVVVEPRNLAQVVWSLRLGFRPMNLRIGLGFGEIASMPTGGETLNVAGSGHAFGLAREAIDSLKRRSGKYRSLTAFRAISREAELVVNGFFRLVDTLLLRVTSRQWETIVAVERSSAQEAAATSLGVGESTVSRNLRRASYWQIKDALEVLGSYMAGPEVGARKRPTPEGCTLESQ